MPLVNVHMATGRSQAQKRALMEAITEAMISHIGAARESIRVWIDEFPADDYMAGGEVLSDQRARMAAQAAAAATVTATTTAAHAATSWTNISPDHPGDGTSGSAIGG